VKEEKTIEYRYNDQKDNNINAFRAKILPFLGVFS
jgi:hypothetical protein